MERKGRNTWFFNAPVYVQSTGTTVGPEEAKGPINDSFDKTYDSLYVGQDTWELAERQLMKDAIQIALKKAGKKEDDINYFLRGIY